MGAHLSREDIKEFESVLDRDSIKIIYIIFLVLFLGYLYLTL
jgi:hypothetical protein